MELKPGYKDTDVGIIPEDWEIIPLGKGLSGRPSYGINAPAVSYSDRLPVYIRITDIDEAGRYNPSKPVSVDSTDSEKFFLEDGDIVFARTGASVGKSYKYRSSDGQLVFAGFLIRVHPDSINLHAPYIAAYATTGPYWRWVQLTSMRSGQPGINGSEYAQLPIPKPPITEQRAIANVLSDVDALLEGLDLLITKKCGLKQGTMQQLLTGKVRLPGFKGEWTEKNMAIDSDLKARIGWQGLTTAEYLESGNYRLVTGTDFKEGKIDWSSCCYVKRERYEQDKKIQLQIGDILLTKDGTIGKVAYVDRLPVAATLNSGVFVIRPINNSYNSLYFYYVLRSRIFTDFLEKLQAGSTINHLYQKDFLNFSFATPQLPEQEAIARVLSDIDAEIAALEERRKKTKDIKKAMMQELLTGKTRLLTPRGSNA